MIQELWHSFPRTLVERINSLLDEAEPSQAKAFQLYKSCQAEGLWDESFEKFQRKLNAFYALPKHDRRKSAMDQVLNGPMPTATFAEFHLNFRNASIDNRSLQSLASWTHHLLRVGGKYTSVVIAEDIISKTLNYITQPPMFEKSSNIDFDDFCEAWRKTVFKNYGKSHDAEMTRIVGELRYLNSQLLIEEQQRRDRPVMIPTIYLTQTEIDWTMAVMEAAEENLEMPKYPLSKGPQKPRLIELLRVVQLYKIVQNTQLPEFVKHRESIRATILDRCQGLLADKAS
ncbi:hypothetical protein ACLSU7_05110 [Bdellovibrio sp. HCB185ZH]|uniref:hypothetical protein n=1 Tax=Bdellovibrio sp. HCB185ZH TaxID=3394235 RepID=UPI0039A64675